MIVVLYVVVVRRYAEHARPKIAVCRIDRHDRRRASLGLKIGNPPAWQAATVSAQQHAPRRANTARRRLPESAGARRRSAGCWWTSQLIAEYGRLSRADG
jgi:hypothetical protein